VHLIRPSRRVFRAIGDALGILDGSAITEFEIGPVKPRLDAAPSVEAASRYLQFMVGQVDGAGGATTVADLDPRTTADWTEVLVNGEPEAGAEVGANEDCWVIGCYETNTSNANFTDTQIFFQLTRAPSLAPVEIVWLGDLSLSSNAVVRGAARDSPILKPLPWFIPPRNVADLTLSHRTLTTNATTWTIVLEVLAAPRGTFKRLY